MIRVEDLEAFYDAETYVTGAPHDAIDRLRGLSSKAFIPRPIAALELVAVVCDGA